MNITAYNRDEPDAIRIFGHYFEIVCGTVEEYLISFSIRYSEDGRFALHSSFANHSHCVGIRRLVVCGQYLVAGGTDEMIHVFNLKKRAKMGVIGEHDGTITDLQQHKQKYVFSAGDDGRICIFKEGKWECEEGLVGHKGPINSLAIHPTGRMALSVGSDRTLHTWDLVKGKKAYVSYLQDAGSLVKWSPSGDRYVVIVDSRVDVYLIESASLTYSMDFFVRINDVVFITEHVVAVALENGRVAVHDLKSRTTVQQWEAHSGRVRTMAIMPIALEEHEHDRIYIITGSSDGWIKVWGIEKSDHTIPAKLMTGKNTQCRITCLTVYSHSDYQQVMRTRIQEQMSTKADNMISRSRKSGMPKGRLQIKREPDWTDEDGEDEDEIEEKPVIVKPRKKKKTVSKDDDEFQEILIDAIKFLDEETEPIKKEPPIYDCENQILERTGRKNRGVPAKRFS